MHRYVRRSLIGFSGAFALYVGVVIAAAYMFLHPVRFGIHRTPDALHLRYENVTFPSATDGLKLHGWYIPASGVPHGLILFCHGRQGNRSSVLEHAAYLHRAGYALFSFDFRDCGDSDGDMSTIGWREVGDALGAAAYLRDRRDTRAFPLGIFGVSMGAAVAIQASAKLPEIRCVIADSPYATLDSAVRRRFFGLMGPGGEIFRGPVERVGETMMGGAALAVSPLTAILQIAPRHILLIHGSRDQICDPEDSRRLFAAAASGTASLWMVNGAGHVGAYRAHTTEYERRVTAFLRERL
jgi:pimeloyl-ACP methyl ester carboxylesterase